MIMNTTYVGKYTKPYFIATLLKQGHALQVVQVYAGHKYPSSTEANKQSQAEELKAAVL